MPNKMKLINVILFVLAIIALLAWGGSIASKPDSTADANGAAVLSVFQSAEKAHDFGSIRMKDGPVTHRFSLLNPSDKPLTIRKMSTSCMCTKAYLISEDGRKGPFGMAGHGFIPPVNESVPQGSSRDIEVVFDPAAHGPAGIGPVDRAVFVEDSNGGKKILTIKALVTP